MKLFDAHPQPARLLSAVDFVTLDGRRVSVPAGKMVQVAYDPRLDEYLVTLEGLHFDIFSDEFELIT